MKFEAKAHEMAVSLHKGTTKVMTPVTLTALAGILFYVVLVFHGLRPPDEVLYADYFVRIGLRLLSVAVFAVKILSCFAVIGGLNTLIFELWVSRQLDEASKIVVWDGSPQDLSDRQAIESLSSLIDFPHRFVIRFIIQWVIGAPLIILTLRIFYPMPMLTIVYLAIGTLAILCLMSTFHYFVVKSYYDEPLSRALRNFPAYFEKRELSRAMVHYRTKILIYVLVLVGSIAWLATHFNLVSQEQSVDLERDKYIGERIESVGISDAFEYRTPSSYELEAKVHLMLGGENNEAYIIDARGENLIGKPVPAVSREIIDSLPQINGLISPASAVFWKRAFTPGRPLIVKVTDRVFRAYAQGREFTISVDKIGPDIHLVTLLPHTRTTIQVLLQAGTALGIFVIALVLSLLFARFMQRELMTPLSRIIASSKKVAAGDLSDPSPVMADDELGEMAVNHLRMVSNIRAMVRQITQASQAIDSATTQIVTRIEEMAEGSEAQSVTVEETAASLTQMNANIASIADSVEALATSAEQSSASIIEMSATNDQVAGSAQDLSNAVVETTTSVQQMSASIKQVAQHVETASGKAGEAASSMREMREAVRQVAQISGESASLSERVTSDAESGVKAVQSTIDGINKIWESSREAGEVIERLSGRARQIGRILTVIEEVTEETNLLALNAAIIAAQAGEHGRGFAVVADEIKDLAERTQASTAEIADLVKAVQDDARAAVGAMDRGEESVSKGVLLSEEAGEALKKIQSSVKSSVEMAKKISGSTEEQSRQADEVLKFFEAIAGMIEQINTATQEQTRGSEQIILSSEKMRDIASQVKKATREQSSGGRQISQAIEHTTQIARYISDSQGEQKKAAQQVLNAMNSIADIATKNVQGVEKVSESVNNLKVMADDLKIMLETFQLDSDQRKTD